MKQIFFIGVIALLFIGVGVFLMSRPFTGVEEKYSGSLPITAGNGAPILIDEVVRVPQTISSFSSTTYSAIPLVSNVSTEKLDDDFYVITENPDTYDIYYYEDTGIIMVMLYQVPLSFSRALAEKKLLGTLPYTKEEICTMHIKVLTNAYVDPIYDGLNLGLSFCPDSVSLE